ncbi:capsule assembly Wzi family protein [Telluribacter sp.]|jgi:hypothetical protein|uniref:capsule assembly Wzi family protein n=1 Tax=Telluribacter sp. TaxID=1978767 RepID=UPI002E1189D0|nr:capsule assembly Wzi family protein [Telluribacter sp.]
MCRRFLLVFLPGILFCFNLSGQSLDTTALGGKQGWMEVSGYSATEPRLPFWLHSNQFGIVPRTGPVLSVRAGIEKLWKLSKNKGTAPAWKAGVGVEAVGNLSPSQKSQGLLPQRYGTLGFGNLELWVGRRKQLVGLADSTLGTGSYIMSGNTVPIPRVQLGLRKFSDVPFTKGWLAILGFYADGWFENNRPVTSELKLHQKQLYGRFGKPGGAWKLYGGFNHQVQWGGKSSAQTVDGQMPKGFQNYLRAVTGRRSLGRLDSTATNFDNTNRVGNHLGTIDAGLEWNGTYTNVFLYRQNLYEDGSLYYLTNVKDGLNGIRIRWNQPSFRMITLKEAVVELLYTKSQGGEDFIIGVGTKRGKDNYFNNAQVADGWSYYDRTIGTPFIPPTTDTSPLWPAYGYTSNNRVAVLHLGLRGTFMHRYEWSTKLSYSSNAGTYDLPFEPAPTQFSGILSVQRKVNWLGPNTILKGSVATDVGELYRNSTGLMLSIRKEGLF